MFSVQAKHTKKKEEEEKEFMEHFQRLKALKNLIKEKHAMHKYSHTNDQ